MLQWAASNGALLNSDTCAAAANGGQLTVLKWLHETQQVDWDERVCENAASGGHLEVCGHVLESVLLPCECALALSYCVRVYECSCVFVRA